MKSILAALILTASTANAWTADADAQFRTDKLRCVRAKTTAETCCENPDLCLDPNAPAPTDKKPDGSSSGSGGAGGSGGGGGGKCGMLQALAGQGAGANDLAGKICGRRAKSCESSCTSLEKSYRQMAEGSPDRAQYLAAAQVFRQQTSSCHDLGADLTSLTEQGGQFQLLAAAAAVCQALTQENPEAKAQQAQAQQFQPSEQSVAQKPAAPEARQTGQASFSQAQKANTSSFLPDSRVAGAAVPEGTGGGQAPQNSASVIPNGGGSFPGGQGAGAAKLNEAATTPNARAKTDIEAGFLSGGGGSFSSGGTAGSFTFHDYAPESSRAKSGTSLSAIDLKRYLPGAGNRAVAGLAKRSADIFERVHMKMTERCSLGKLYQCN